jgi:hypothetical protein
MAAFKAFSNWWSSLGLKAEFANQERHLEVTLTVLKLVRTGALTCLAVKLDSIALFNGRFEFLLASIGYFCRFSCSCWFTIFTRRTKLLDFSERTQN